MPPALFGGTFDPIHNAHLTVAREAADRFALERVLFVPAAHPPHKPESMGASFDHRYRMVELACASDPRFHASRLEEGGGKSYSIDTIQKVGGNPFFIIGADAFAEIESWHRWRDVVRLAEFIVVTRPGHEYLVPSGAKVQRLDTLALPVSSSEIRREIAAGRIPPDLPPVVGDYISRHRLYRF